MRKLLALLVLLMPVLMAQVYRTDYDTTYRTTYATSYQDAGAGVFACPSNADICRFIPAEDQDAACTALGWDAVPFGADATACRNGRLNGAGDTRIDVEESLGQITHSPTEVYEVWLDYEFVSDAAGAGADPFVLIRDGVTRVCAIGSENPAAFPANILVTSSPGSGIDTGADILANGDKFRLTLVYDPIDGGCDGRVDPIGGTHGAGSLGSARDLTSATVGATIDEVTFSNAQGSQNALITNAAACAGGCGAAATNSPSIVEIIFDDVGTLDVDAQATPALDSLATAGARFDNFHTSPVCAMTRLSARNGRDPNRNAYFSSTGQNVDRTGLFLGQALQSQGYSTHLIGKSGLDCEIDLLCSPNTQGGAAFLLGFQTFWGSAGAAGQLTGVPENDWADWGRSIATNSTPPLPVTQSTYQWEDQLAECIRRIQTTPIAEQSFISCSLNAVHRPSHDPSSPPYVSSFCGGTADEDCIDEMLTFLDDAVDQIRDAMPNKSRDYLVAWSDNGPWTATTWDTVNCDGAKGWASDCGIRNAAWVAYGGAVSLTTPGDDLAVYDLPATYMEIAGGDFDSFVGYPTDGKSFFDRITSTGNCSVPADNCSSTRPWIYATTPIGSADPEFYAIKEIGTNCKLRCPGTNDWCNNAATMYVLPDEKTPSSAGVCDAEKADLMANQAMAQFWSGEDESTTNYRDWCDEDAQTCELLAQNEQDCEELRFIGYAAPTGDCNVLTAPPSTGALYSMRVEPDASQWGHNVFAPGGDTWTRFDFFIRVDTSTTVELIFYGWDITGAASQWEWKTNGTAFQIEVRGDVQHSFMIGEVVLGTWYRGRLETNLVQDLVHIWIDPEDGEHGEGALALQIEDGGTMTGPSDQIWFTNGGTDTLFHRLLVENDVTPTDVGGGSLTAAFTASKIQGSTCVAPCVVHFDAIGDGSDETVDTAYARDFHSLLFEWDFDDNTADSCDGVGATWTHSGRLKDRAIGGVAGHAFCEPGSYDVELTVTAPDGETDTAIVNVVVADPATAFAPANTYCFAAFGTDFTGCSLDTSGGDGVCDGPSAGNCITQANAATAMGAAGAASSKVWVQFKGGDSFSGDLGNLYEGNANAAMVSAFGTGKAIFTASNVSVADGWTLASLSFTGTTDQYGINGTDLQSGSNMTLYDVDHTGPSSGCSGSSFSGGSISQVTDLYANVEYACTVGASFSGYAHWGGMDRAVWMGWTIDGNDHGGNQFFRARSLSWSLLQHSEFSNFTAPSRIGKFACFDDFSDGTDEQQACKYFLMSDNLLYDDSGDGTATIQFGNDSAVTCTESACGGSCNSFTNRHDTILERNYLRVWNGGSKDKVLWMSGGDWTFRDNIVDLTGMNPEGGPSPTRIIQYTGDYTAAGCDGLGPTVDDTGMHMFGNTIATADTITEDFALLQISATNTPSGCTSDCLVRNNTIVGEAWSGSAVETEANFDYDNNVYLDNLDTIPFVTDPLPSAGTGVPADFDIHVTNGTALIDTGYDFVPAMDTTGWDWLTHDGECRVTTNSDVGADDLAASACP